jgi:hypothetical protein
VDHARGDIRRLGRRDEAIADLRHAPAIDPQQTRASEALSRLLSAQNGGGSLH